MSIKPLPNIAVCPCCCAAIDRYDEIYPGCMPLDNDFTVCADCGEILNYVIANNKYSFRKATEQDLKLAQKCGFYNQIIYAQAEVKRNYTNLN